MVGAGARRCDSNTRAIVFLFFYFFIMGRYYSGDIEGKFWFAVQSSDDGEFFGAEAQEPCEVPYYVDEDKLEHVKEQVQVCLDTL